VIDAAAGAGAEPGGDWIPVHDQRRNPVGRVEQVLVEPIEQCGAVV
jgi:hypothetical protein